MEWHLRRRPGLWCWLFGFTMVPRPWLQRCRCIIHGPQQSWHWLIAPNQFLSSQTAQYLRLRYHLATSICIALSHLMWWHRSWLWSNWCVIWCHMTWCRRSKIPQSFLYQLDFWDPITPAVVAGRGVVKPKELPSLKHGLELLDGNSVGNVSKGFQGFNSDSRQHACWKQEVWLTIRLMLGIFLSANNSNLRH